MRFYATLRCSCSSTKFTVGNGVKSLKASNLTYSKVIGQAGHILAMLTSHADLLLSQVLSKQRAAGLVGF